MTASKIRTKAPAAMAAIKRGVIHTSGGICGVGNLALLYRKMGRTRAGKRETDQQGPDLLRMFCAADDSAVSFPWVYAFDYVANNSFGQIELIRFLQPFFYLYRTEPRLAVCFHETFSSLLVRLVMHPFWRSGDSKQTPRRLISGGCADSRLDYVQCLIGYAQINLMSLSGCKPACLTASPQLPGFQVSDIFAGSAPIYPHMANPVIQMMGGVSFMSAIHIVCSMC